MATTLKETPELQAAKTQVSHYATQDRITTAYRELYAKALEVNGDDKQARKAAKSALLLAVQNWFN